MWLSIPDWSKVFVPTVPLLETIVRGSVIYIGILVLLRVVLKRQTTSLNTADLLVVVLLADASQNGLAGQYQSVTEGLVLIATILVWDYVVDWLTFRSPTFRRLLHPPPLLLIKDGALQHRNMRRELVSQDELRTRMHEEGIGKFEEVRRAWIEGDGTISFLKKDTK